MTYISTLLMCYSLVLQRSLSYCKISKGTVLNVCTATSKRNDNVKRIKIIMQPAKAKHGVCNFLASSSSVSSQNGMITLRIAHTCSAISSLESVSPVILDTAVTGLAGHRLYPTSKRQSLPFSIPCWSVNLPRVVTHNCWVQSAATLSVQILPRVVVHSRGFYARPAFALTICPDFATDGDPLLWLLRTVSGYLDCLSISCHRLVGLVVKASASRAEDPRFKCRLRRDFFGVEPYQ